MENSETTKNLEGIVDQLSGLTLVEASALVRRLREKWGISDSIPAPGLMIPAQQIVSVVEEAIVKDAFDVVLRDFGQKKIEVIKAVRQISGLGLKEAKDLVETPVAIIASQVDKDR